MRLLQKLWVQRHSHWTQWMAARGHGGRLWGRKRPLRWWAGSICPLLPPHLASRQPEASLSTMGKFSVSGWLKMLTLEGAIEGNINTVDGGGSVYSSIPTPFHWLSSFSFQLLSPFFAIQDISLIHKTSDLAIFPIPCKGADDKN